MVWLNIGYEGCRMRRLTYALKDEVMVHVDDVESGKKCGCVCPYCGASLTARNQGTSISHHFAHPAFQHTITDNKESDLHKLAKTIIATHKQILLPGYFEYLQPQQFRFDEIEVEERNDYKLLQPDCVGIKFVDNIPHRLWIEIKVTHGIDQRKMKQICENSQACIEIDMRRFRNTNYSEEDVRNFLLFSSEDRRWIYTPYQKFHENSLQEEFNKRVQVGQMWLRQHQDCRAIALKQCETCPLHTFRERLHDFMMSYPIIQCNPLLESEISSLELSRLQKPLVTRRHNHHSVISIGRYHRFLKDVVRNKSEHNLYHFLRTTLPEFAQNQLTHCTHIRMTLWDGVIACDCPHAWQVDPQKTPSLR